MITLPLYSKDRVFMINRWNTDNRLGIATCCKTSNKWFALSREYKFYYVVYINTLVYNLITLKR